MLPANMLGATIAVVSACRLRAALRRTLARAADAEAAGLAPLPLAFLAISDIHARVAIVVARDFPCEAERNQSGRLDDEFAGRSGRLTPGQARQRKRQKKAKDTHSRLLYPQDRALTGPAPMRANKKAGDQEQMRSERIEKRCQIARILEAIHQ